MAEGRPSPEEFADWLEPSDVIEWYHQQGEADPRGLVASMLSDGLLQAAAAQLIIHGKDVGLALIPRELWPAIAATQPDVWHTGRFRLASMKVAAISKGVSGYGVRIDRNIRTLPRPARTAEPPEPQRPQKQPLSETRLRAWAELFFAAHRDATEAESRQSLNVLFPDNTITRARLRALLPSRERGRPRRQEGN
jgi:hypothetical protein